MGVKITVQAIVWNAECEWHKRSHVGVQREQISLWCEHLGKKAYPGSISGELWLILTGQERFCNNPEYENKGLLGSHITLCSQKFFAFLKITICDEAHDPWRRVNRYEDKEVVWALNTDSLNAQASECSFS